MKRKLSRAVKLVAKMKAYDAYCRLHRLPHPDLTDATGDPRLVQKHGQALAWAEQHWEEFLNQIDDEESQFLLRLTLNLPSCAKDDHRERRCTSFVCMDEAFNDENILNPLAFP